MGKTASRIGIIPASSRDVEAIYEISRLCLPGETWRRETVAADREREGTHWFVAREEGRTLGFASFWFVLDEAELVNTAVLPEARKRGLASRLLEEGLAEAKRRGMKTMFLEVRVGNAPAIGLYQKYGFRILGTRKGEYDHPREDGYIMQRELP